MNRFVYYFAQPKTGVPKRAPVLSLFWSNRLLNYLKLLRNLVYYVK